MKNPIACIALTALSFCLLACSSAPTSTAPRAGETAQGPATSAGRAESIAAALRASQVERNPARALAHIERALTQEPQRAELLWLAARLCADVPRCDPTQFEARLRKVDSGNGVVWMGPLTRAQDKGDTAAETQILEALSREARFDVYWNSLLSQAAVVVSREARQPAPKMLNGPLTNAINDVGNWLSAVAVPSFAGLANACSRERTHDTRVAERCRKIAKVLQQGDTYAAEAVGIGIAQRAISPDSPNSIALTEHAAVLSYRHDTARDVMAEQVEREKVSAELIQLMQQLRREQEVSLAVLRWAGLPLTPNGIRDGVTR